MSLGDHAIKVICTDLSRNSATQTIDFKAVDNTAPHYSIIEPKSEPGKDGIQIPGNETSDTIVTVKGSSQDIQSGMELITCSLDEVAQETVTSPDNWISWSVFVPIPNFGPHDINITFFDKVGNKNGVSLKLDVMRVIKPKDAKDVLSIRFYFQDLLSFAQDSIYKQPNVPVKIENLESSIYTFRFSTLLL